MADIKPEDMLDIRNVALLREIIPVLEAEVSKLDRALDNRVLGASVRGDLTPDQALQAWYEKFAYRRLLSTLYQKAQLGASKAAMARTALEMQG